MVASYIAVTLSPSLIRLDPDLTQKAILTAAKCVRFQTPSEELNFPATMDDCREQ
jgi:hypothetical protein